MEKKYIEFHLKKKPVKGTLQLYLPRWESTIFSTISTGGNFFSLIYSCSLYFFIIFAAIFYMYHAYIA